MTMAQLSALNFTYGYLFFLNYYSDFFFRENWIIQMEILAHLQSSVA